MSDQADNFASSNSILSTPIEALPLSTRSYNSLKRRGIYFVGQILNLGEEGVLQLHKVGPKQLDEIFHSVAQYLGVSREELTGLELSGDISSEEVVSSSQILELPISVLRLSGRPSGALALAGICTIGDLLQARSIDLRRIRGLGRKSVNEIEIALSQFLDASGPLSFESLDSSTVEEPEYLEDPRPFLVNTELHSIPNLVRLIVPFSKALLKSLKYDREFEIVRRLYGLEDSDIYTLQEIGYYYDIKRQRVHQLKSKAIGKIRKTLMDSAESQLWRVPDNLRTEARDLYDLLRSAEKVQTEQEIIRVVEDRYSVTLLAGEENELRFLLTLFGFRPLPSSISTTGFCGDLSSAWVIADDLERSVLYRAVAAVHSVLLASVMPLSFFDLKIELNRRRKSRIDTEYIRYAVNVCSDTDWVNDETCQIRFECLPSLADKAYRIVREADEPMHTRDIWRQMNHRMVRAGFPGNVRIRSLREQLVTDSRFEPVGRSGVWSLSDWDHIRRDTVVELMREFLHLKQTGATVDEIYEYVRSKRLWVSKKTVLSFLATQKSVFIRVSRNKYELSDWGGKPSRRKQTEIQSEELQSEIQAIFAERQVDALPLGELIREIMERTGMANSTAYQKVGESTLIESLPSPLHSRRKIARYVGVAQPAVVSQTPKRRTIREAVQQEIKDYLRTQHNYEALVADVATNVMKRTSCKRATFYSYLSDLTAAGDVRKENRDGKLFCFMEAEEGGAALSFPQVERIEDEALRDNINRAIRYLNIEDVDLGLFHLGRLFEQELKSFLMEAREKGALEVNRKDLQRLASMIDCVERNGIIKKKHHLTLLREERNERAHGEIAGLTERKRLLQYAPFLGDLYIDYIILLHKRRNEL